MKIKKNSQDQIIEYLLISLREFGIAGTATVIGGTILLTCFPFIENVEKARLFGLVGFGLVFLSIINSYIRLIIQKAREKLLIQMVENSCNRLAEQLAKKGMNNHKVDGVSQKIRQILRDTTETVYSVNLMDGNQKNKKD